MIHCLVLKYNIVIVNMMQFTLWYCAVPHQYLSGGADQSAFMNQCWLIGLLMVSAILTTGSINNFHQSSACDCVFY